MNRLIALTLLVASSAALAIDADAPHRVHTEFSSSEEAHELRQLKLEIRALRRDIQRLEERLIFSERAANEASHPEYDDKKWGCFMQDLSAGGLFSTGSTKAEAKGRLLERCTQKKGACFEKKVECSSE